MSAEDLERRVSRLEQVLPNLAEELQFAVRYVRPDAGSSLTKSRLVLEKIVVQVYLAETGHEPRKPLLAEMLSDNQFTRKIDRRILSRMNAIRDMGNLGPHGEPVQASDAARVLEDLCEVLDWYLTRYVQPRAPGEPPAARQCPSPRPRFRWPALAAAVLVTVAALGAWLWWRPGAAPQENGEPAGEPPQQGAKAPAPPAPAPVVVEVGLAKPPAGESLDKGDADIRVTYEYKRDGDTLYVTSRLPYLERLRTALRSDRPIQGLFFQHDTFDWELPKLSVKVLNNSTQSVLLTEGVAEVTKSIPDTEPVLVIADRALNGVMLINEGWGDVIDPVLTFSIHRLGKDTGTDSAARHTLRLKTFAADRLVPLAKYVPGELEDEKAVGVRGELEFGPPNRRAKLQFTTTMSLETTYEHLVPPSQEYNLALTAGKAPETIRVPLAHNLKPGEADHFLLRVASDKSARYELTLRLRRIDGELLPEQKVVLDLFVPRSAAKRVEKAGAVTGTRPGPEEKKEKRP